MKKHTANSPDELMEWIAAGAKPKPKLAAASCSPALADIANRMEAEAAELDRLAGFLKRAGMTSGELVAATGSRSLRHFASKVRQCQESDQTLRPPAQSPDSQQAKGGSQQCPVRPCRTPRE